MNGLRHGALRIALASVGAVGASQVDEIWMRIQQNEPGLRAISEERAQAEGGQTAMGAWMPPEAKIEQMWMMDGAPDATTISLSQSIPLSGQPGFRRQAEGRRVDMAKWSEADARKSREATFRKTWWDLWGMRQQMGIVRERLDLFAQAEEVARAQRVTGMNGTESILKLLTARSRVRMDSLDLVSRMREMEAMILSWVGGPSDSTVGEIEAPAAEPTDFVASDSLAAAQPGVKGMRAEAEMSELEAKAEKRGLWPDLMVGGTWKQSYSDLPGGYGVMAGITLPFAPWASGMPAGKARQAEARGRKATWNALAMERMERARLQALQARIAALRGRLAVLDSSILPQALDGRNLSMGALAAGTGSLAMVLETTDMVAMAKMERVMARAALAQAESEWRVAQEMAVVK